MQSESPRACTVLIHEALSPKHDPRLTKDVHERRCEHWHCAGWQQTSRRLLENLSAEEIVLHGGTGSRLIPYHSEFASLSSVSMHAEQSISQASVRPVLQQTTTYLALPARSLRTRCWIVSKWYFLEIKQPLEPQLQVTSMPCCILSIVSSTHGCWALGQSGCRAIIPSQRCHRRQHSMFGDFCVADVQRDLPHKISTHTDGETKTASCSDLPCAMVNKNHCSGQGHPYVSASITVALSVPC